MIGTNDPGSEGPGRFFQAGDIQIFLNINIGEIPPPVRIGKRKALGKKADPGPLASGVMAAVNIPAESEDHRQSRLFGKTADEEPFIRVEAVYPKFHQIHIFPVFIQNLQIPFQSFGGQTKAQF
jgi:hypothetical protein